jgi:hypothetical protein
MKSVPSIFWVMIAIVFLLGTTHAQQTDRSSESLSRRSETSGDAREKPNDETQESSTSTMQSSIKRRASASHSKPVPTYPARPARKPTASRVGDPSNFAPLETIRSKTPTSIPGKVVNHRSSPVLSSSVSINGQQLKNFRDPGAHLATNGGPATISRGTAAINGPTMKTKR